VNSYDFKGRVAVITGAGIGLTVAERMLDSRASVSIWHRDETLLDALEAKHAKSGKVQVISPNIGKLDPVGVAAKAVIDRFKNIDVLINNAAIVGPNANT
jgi:NAD(P)-dependent dehydrogenase (short-subunit alcohol dehydrogenase family)